MFPRLALAIFALVLAGCSQSDGGFGQPQSFSGTGPTSTPTFDSGAASWTACFEITKPATYSDGSPVGLIFVTIYAEDGTRVGRLAGDAENPDSRSGCTTIRSRGGHYFDVNVGADIEWRVEAS